MGFLAYADNKTPVISLVLLMCHKMLVPVHDYQIEGKIALPLRFSACK